MAAISANHDLVEGRSVRKHNLVIRYFRGARRLNSPRLHLIPSWDLAMVLQAFQQDPFEPLQSVNLSALSMETALLTVLTSVKGVGDLQALSGNGSCLEFGPADSHIVLRPRHGYVPKPFRRFEQLFGCFGGQQKGNAVFKQRISNWLVDVIRMAYQAIGLPCHLGVRAHSTRGVAASAAFANVASLTDICRAAGRATPNTFARFYNLCMEPVSARVLNASSSTQ
ncbi:tRNA-5-methyluridine(54) 2-sulfurtransferase [Labeo rohita]|uniref:tRNA-5-methyluridine(54) 2-sulfurtransferase n=1 Tax=Labeo rohita TaxID=84645 RepID=A0ABQ8MML1_LABRO|nr:tRNA-5-methyluridine(54) 2-sulfurtransferase [Labeo rohita]